MKGANSLPAFIQAPDQTISKKAVTVWRLSSLFSNGITLIIVGVLYFLHKTFAWPNWIGTGLLLLAIFVLLQLLYKSFIFPVYMQRTWRYRIDAQFIQLKFGFIHVHHIVIPMNRIEYVNMNDGPLLRKYHLSTITIGTIASTHNIPALNKQDAKNLRDQIVAYAQLEENAGDDDE